MLDTLIHNATVLTVDPDFTILGNGAVGVRQGAIEMVATLPAGQPLPPARESIDARGDIVMPGLVNAHTHLPMALFRGLKRSISHPFRWPWEPGWPVPRCCWAALPPVATATF